MFLRILQYLQCCCSFCWKTHTHSEADRVPASLEDASRVVYSCFTNMWSRPLPCDVVVTCPRLAAKACPRHSSGFLQIPMKRRICHLEHAYQVKFYSHSAQKVFRTQNTCKKPIPNTFAHRNFIELENQCSKSPYDLLNFQVLVFWVYDNVCACVNFPINKTSSISKEELAFGMQSFISFMLCLSAYGLG